MSQILNDNEIKEFNKDGAIFLKEKFDKNWIEKLKIGFKKAKLNPSPRFVNHTKNTNHTNPKPTPQSAYRQNTHPQSYT